MATLSSILVQRGAVTMRAVEDAIARQVFHGGDLATNLLEVGAVREDALLPIVAECVSLPPGPTGRLPAPPARVLRLVPGELALRHSIFPLELADRHDSESAERTSSARALIVATAEPLSPTVEDDLGFALDLAIRQVVAPLVRIRQAIAEHYGIPLERRFLRLVAKLDGQVDPSPSAAPPPARDLLPAKMPRPISIPSPSFGTGVDGARLGDELPAMKTPFVAAHDFVNPAIPRSPALPRDAVAEIETPPAFVAVTLGGDPPDQPVQPVPEAAPSPAIAEQDEPRVDLTPSLEGARPASAPPPEAGFLPTERAAPAPSRPADPGGTRALAGVVKQALRAERASAPVDKTRREARPAWRPAHRRKGPFTAAMAERELEEATGSEAVLEIVFAFAQQFFTYTAIFVVHGDVAEGRDAMGPGASAVIVGTLGIPLDKPSSLARVRERRAPLVGRLEAEGPDADLARDLGRAPRAIALLPVVVKTRVVAILYGDDGATDVELAALGDVLAMIGLAGAALERIALRKKRGLHAPEAPLKVRIVEAQPAPPPAELRAQAVAALARVVTATAEAAEVAAPQVEAAPPQVEVAAPEIEAAPPQVEVAPPEIEVAEEMADAADATLEAAEEPEPPPVALYVDDTVTPPDSGDDAAFGVSPPDDSVLPPSQGPRTARYFDEPRPEQPVKVPSLRHTNPGIGIQFPDSVTPPPAAVAEEPLRADSWLPIAPRQDAAKSEPTEPPPAMRRATPAPTRRGLAPVFEGRAAAAKPAAPIGFEPLPSTPPPNATAWTSFPSAPPPETAVRPARTRSVPPIPREEADDAPAEPKTRPAARASDGPARGEHLAVPTVVVDVSAEYQSLVQRVIDGGRGSHEAFEDLVRHGDLAASAVMARFPGPVRVDRHRARGELPAASQCGPILELCVAIRRPSLPFLSVRLASTDPDVRFWATHVLGELRYPEAATALLPRLFDDDPHVRRIARRSAAALVGAGAAGAPILKGMSDLIRNLDEAPPHRVLAIETMGEIRCGAVVPSLIETLEDRGEEIADAARRSLLVITRQDFGLSVARWQEWWAKNGKRHRIEWLIDALMHEQPSVRRAAGDELKLVTKEYFGYYDDLPKRERERAQTLYRAWWEREGRARFA